MSFSDFYEDYVLNLLLGVTTWVGLSTADPTDDASGLAEPSGNAYARVETPASYWASSSGGSKTNSTAIVFPIATGSWGTVTYACIFDAATSGNLLMSFALDSGLSVTTGVTPTFNISGLAVTLD